MTCRRTCLSQIMLFEIALFLLAFKDVYGFIKSSFVDTLNTFSSHVASCDSVQARVDLFVKLEIFNASQRGSVD